MDANLGGPDVRLAGAARASQGHLNPFYERVRVPEHAPSNPFQILERRHALAEIIERGAVIFVERQRVIQSHESLVSTSSRPDLVERRRRAESKHRARGGLVLL